MLEPEIIDKFRDLDVNIDNLFLIDRRADPMDKMAGAHIINQGDISVYKSDDLVIKIAPSSKINDYLKEARIFEYLKSNEFEAPEKTLDPMIIGNWAILFSKYIEHDPIETPDPVKTGHKIAELHQLPAPEWLAVNNKMDTKVSQIINNKSYDQITELIVDKFLPINEKVKNINIGNQQFCHGDLHLGNILTTKQGSIRLIDFESASAGDPLWDISRMAQASDKYGLDITWYQKFWESWNITNRYNETDLALFNNWRSWYGVIDLLNRPNLNDLEKLELQKRLDWAQNGTISQWTRI